MQLCFIHIVSVAPLDKKNTGRGLDQKSRAMGICPDFSFPPGHPGTALSTNLYFPEKKKKTLS